MSLPLSSGKMSAIAVALPVDVGARFIRPERARRRSAFFALGASMIVCVLVTQWMVVSMPRTMRSLSCTTLTSGARQFVVHEAAVTMLCCAASYSFCTARAAAVFSLRRS